MRAAGTRHRRRVGEGTRRQRSRIERHRSSANAEKLLMFARRVGEAQVRQEKLYGLVERDRGENALWPAADSRQALRTIKGHGQPRIH